MDAILRRIMQGLLVGLGALAVWSCAQAGPADSDGRGSAATSGLDDSKDGVGSHADPAGSSAPTIGSNGASVGAGGSGAGFAVPSDSEICNESLAFSVPGCRCVRPASQACWTGPPNLRNVGLCHDGMQTCLGNGELGTWGPCEGEQLACAPADAAPPEPSDACGCIPGVTVGCSEDCEALIICSLSGYKTCLPDGTWGLCRETGDLAGAANNLLGCRSVFHGCFPGNEEGLFTGDCSQAFSCGRAPGAL